MITAKSVELEKVTPRCPVFGECGGCAYQDIPYEQELRVKEENLKVLLKQALGMGDEIMDPIVGSPESYHYRSRLDLGVRRTKGGEFFMGFMPPGRHRIISVDSCAIARKEISDFLPQLRDEAHAKLPENYRTANLVIKTGNEGKIAWGGIGRRSLQMKEEDYFWTEVCGKRIFYSLNSHFHIFFFAGKRKLRRMHHDELKPIGMITFIPFFQVLQFTETIDGRVIPKINQAHLLIKRLTLRFRIQPNAFAGKLWGFDKLIFPFACLGHT